MRIIIAAISQVLMRRRRGWSLNETDSVTIMVLLVSEINLGQFFTPLRCQ